MASLSGLRSGDFTDIDVLYTININGSAGQNEQVISSDGTNSSWTDPHDLLDLEDLTAGTGIAYTSGTTYDGSLARTITTSNVPNSALANSTISGVSLGSNLANLSAGTNVSFTYPGTYNGSAAITINATDTNTTYSAGDGLDLTGTTFSADLKSGSGLTITSGEIDLSSIPNSALTNDDITIGSTSIALGATSTTIAGMTGITYSGAGGNNLTGGGGAGGETIATYLDLTSNTNLMPSLYPNNVKPYLVFDVYDPASLDSDALTTSYAEIFSGNLSNTFTAQTTAVLVELQIFNAVYTSGRYTYLGLWDDDGAEWSGGDESDGGGDGTGTTNTQRVFSIADETDKKTIQASWYLQGLSVGTSYTINPTAKTNGTTNYIFAGGGDGLYPACILKVSNI